MNEPEHISVSTDNLIGSLACEHLDPRDPDDVCGKTDCPNFSIDANIWW